MAGSPRPKLLARPVHKAGTQGVPRAACGEEAQGSPQAAVYHRDEQDRDRHSELRRARGRRRGRAEDGLRGQRRHGQDGVRRRHRQHVPAKQRRGRHERGQYRRVFAREGEGEGHESPLPDEGGEQHVQQVETVEDAVVVHNPRRVEAEERVRERPEGLYLRRRVPGLQGGPAEKGMVPQRRQGLEALRLEVGDDRPHPAREPPGAPGRQPLRVHPLPHHEGRPHLRVAAVRVAFGHRGGRLLPQGLRLV
mmetsp:Transcript_89031/g.249177  ORF Transcript_89031/g.249177 Transcript_89031/m.249177 type:complete len:250 (+) Transcript_89031:254-1003(+)